MNEDDLSKHHLDDGVSMEQSMHENDNPSVGGGGSVMGDSESRSDVTDGSNSSVTVLPWAGGQRGGRAATCGTAADSSNNVRPGEYVMRSLFADFTAQAEKKLDQVLAEPQEKPLSKVLQRGEDPVFDQLLIAFGSVAEHCLPSILRALFAWYERQMRPSVEAAASLSDSAKKTPENRGKGLFSGDPVETKEAETILQERRDLAVEFVFCLILIEVLKQLPFHPGHDNLVTYIETVAFKHFKYREGIQNDPNATNIHTVADLYAEVLGVLAQSRFQSVRKRFMSELKELRFKEPNTHTTQSIISLLMGMKFFRVKMVPIEEFEASFQFMQECAQYFTDVKDKDVKHALAGLFVEILVPVAATVNVPCLKNFVESLYGSTLDMCTKSKHRLAIFPLVTCLLCVSQKTFFLQNWHYFLAMCLSHLKNHRDPKISRVALESLYRLLWVYMIRIKCESNSATQSRLQSIVNSLFPKGSKAVVPRDTPLNIFVKIIQFIAQERLDFAMREIVFDLLSVGRPIKLILTPERMSIGLRAFLVVADSLQQKEGEPPMPRTSGVLPSGNTLRVKKTYLNKMLTEDTARSIGMSAYFPHVRRVFVDILRALDIHYGRPLMMTSTQNVNKEPDEMITGERKPRIDLFRTCVAAEPDEMITGERKPRIDLFRTCVAAVPRLIPDAMTGGELVDLLSRLTLHMDEELRALAYQSLQTLVIDFPDWRHDVLAGFTQFLAREVLDTFPQLVDNGLRMLLQLLTSWKNALAHSSTNSLSGSLSRNKEAANQKKTDNSNLSNLTRSQVFHQVEGFALVMLCNVRLTPRRLSVHILREVKMLNKVLGCSEHADQNVIDVIDKACPDILDQCMSQLTCADKTAALSASCIDLQWIADRSASIWTADRSASIWTAGIHEDSNRNGSVLNLSPSCSAPDPWGFCLFQFLQKGRVLTYCPSAVAQAWPIVYSRLHTLFPTIDPTPVSDNRASLLRSSAPPRKPVSERDSFLSLWRYLAIFSARVVPPVPYPTPRCASPDLSLSWSPENVGGERGGAGVENKPAPTASPPPSPTGLYKLLVPLLRCDTTDVRDAVVHALGNINSEALKDLMEELSVYIREAVDRKTENMRRRRRRDALRLQLVRVFELIAEHGTFGACSPTMPGLLSPLAEYVDGARLCLELEADKQILREIKAHFCNFVCKMIHSFPLESRQTLLKRDLRRNLFSLFTSWAGQYGRNLNITQSYSVSMPNPPASNPGPEALKTSEEELQLTSLSAMSAVLTCGPVFDPSTLLAEDGVLYPWLDMLLASSEEKTYQIGCQTVILLLECNPDMGPLLDWVVDRCYTASVQVADGCFLALATLFSAREYPCDHYTAIINVALMNTGCPRTQIHETALQLLHLLDKRFFGTVDLLVSSGADSIGFESGE
ncbi:hypothetical protein M8J75_014651 [Diaphorina citri]|nr:hypothetical protein M8J75_014651 [Diaphorina citri]